MYSNLVHVSIVFTSTSIEPRETDIVEWISGRNSSVLMHCCRFFGSPACYTRCARSYCSERLSDAFIWEIIHFRIEIRVDEFPCAIKFLNAVILRMMHGLRDHSCRTDLLKSIVKDVGDWNRLIFQLGKKWCDHFQRIAWKKLPFQDNGNVEETDTEKHFSSTCCSSSFERLLFTLEGTQLLNCVILDSVYVRRRFSRTENMSTFSRSATRLKNGSLLKIISLCCYLSCWDWMYTVSFRFNGVGESSPPDEHFDLLSSMFFRTKTSRSLIESIQLRNETMMKSICHCSDLERSFEVHRFSFSSIQLSNQTILGTSPIPRHRCCSHEISPSSIESN